MQQVQIHVLQPELTQQRPRVREVNDNPSFVVWSLAYIRDLRSRLEREDELLATLIDGVES